MWLQTTEALIERKIWPWLDKWIITQEQFKDIVYRSYEFWFWEALWYATRLKHKNEWQKFEYTRITYDKNKVPLDTYKTKANKIRKWKNQYHPFYHENEYPELVKLKSEGWKIHKYELWTVLLKREINK